MLDNIRTDRQFSTLAFSKNSLKKSVVDAETPSFLLLITGWANGTVGNPN
jgi:hypothetical protein